MRRAFFDSEPPQTLEWIRDHAAARLQNRSTAFRRAELQQEVARGFPRASPQTKVKIHMILLQVMMGDIVGAMREMSVQAERENRKFNRLLVDQLNDVQKARAELLQAMARRQPPRAHDNTNDPASAARDQNRQAKYTQWVSVTTQMMSELQNTERELMDQLREAQRQQDELWQAYASLRDAESRTTRKVVKTK